MKDKSNRLIKIKELIKTKKIGSQDDLLKYLHEEDFELTQATLSRDLKQLKVAKRPSPDKGYIYILPEDPIEISEKRKGFNHLTTKGFVSIAFNGNLAVIKTKPGYSSGIAADLDDYISNEILGTIAGDDTILIIPKENITKEKLLEILSGFLPIL